MGPWTQIKLHAIRKMQNAILSHFYKVQSLRKVGIEITFRGFSASLALR